jgi:hypothetical protein
MLELLEKYPEAAKVIVSYYLEKMLEGLNDDKLPENFKDFVRAQGVDNDKIAKILEASPRNLFDVFDSYGFYADIMHSEEGFYYSILNSKERYHTNVGSFSSRKECDTAAVTVMIQLLNSKLCEQTQ